jgi:hypothetical protein
VPISAESKFIKKVLSQVKAEMASQEIAYLCTLLNEDEEFVYINQGAMSLVRLQMGVNEEPPFYVKSIPSTFTKTVTKKYVLLTSRRLIAFDDKCGIPFETRRIISYGKYQKYSRARSLIICETDEDGQYLFILLRDYVASKFMDEMNIHREFDDFDNGVTRLRDGFEIGSTFEMMLHSEYGFSKQEVQSILEIPEQWDI